MRATMATVLFLSVGCATARPLTQPLGSVSFVARGQMIQNLFSTSQVWGSRTQISRRADGSWAGTCAGEPVDVTKGPTYRIFGGRLAAGSDIANVLGRLSRQGIVAQDAAEGPTPLMPQTALALLCLE